MNIVPAVGERAIIVGQTGSGKTAFACFLLPYLNDGIIYDTKIEPKFTGLDGAVVVDGFDKAKKALHRKDVRFAILRPTSSQVIDPEFLDGLLQRHYSELRGSTAYIDEAYQFHNNGRCGPGLSSLLTRGRSRGITTIMSSQRPQWISRFCLTESQRFYLFMLADKKDRQRFADIIPSLDVDSKVERHWFQYFDYDLDAPILFQPVPIDNLNNEAQAYHDADIGAVKFL